MTSRWDPDSPYYNMPPGRGRRRKLTEEEQEALVKEKREQLAQARKKLEQGD